MTTKSRKLYEIEVVRDAAATRWKEIIAHLANVDPTILDGKHHPCPKCGGTDRFRAFDDQSGGAICNKCFSAKNGDGFAVLQWLTGEDFGQSLKRIAEYIGVKPSKNGRGRKKNADPEEHLEFQDWNEMLIALWCMRREPITPEAVKAFGGRVARYRERYQVVAFPIWGEHLNKATPVGWILYPLGGRSLPKFTGKGQPPEWVKVKVAYGSTSGIVGNVDSISAATTIWKLEGPTDAMAVHGILPGGHIAITNSNGAKERPKQWIIDLVTEKVVNVLHDADQPGQDGAMFAGEADGRSRPGWAPSLATTAAEVRNVVLPYEIKPDHGNDVRDWLSEGNGFADLELLVGKCDLVAAADASEDQAPVKVIEADDDPYRLARVNLDKYAEENSGATLLYWQREFFQYRNHVYRKLDTESLQAKLSRAIKREFDRLNLAAQVEYQDWLKSDEYEPKQDKGPPKAKKVTRGLVGNVIDATKAICVISNNAVLGSWIDRDTGEHTSKDWIAFANGILDVDALLSDKDDVMLEHSPAWFSTIRLPYQFDPEAKCPKWDAFLQYNLEGDAERIAILQEWAGYCLLPDTGQQKFIILEGDGANGKSVYMAALEAMIGTDNCSHVPLEQFAEKFAKAQTIGKLVNLSTDVSELDSVAEGQLKSFTAGERMEFDRKFLPPIEAYPTARLMVAFNNRPRFSDKSSGIWRRIILIPFTVQVPESKRVPNMDKPWWWEQSGELPAILMWAIYGLARLRQQGKFSSSKKLTKAIDDYRTDGNPARLFLADNYIADNKDNDSSVQCAEIYDRYKKWCSDDGYRALSDRVFGREVARAFPSIERKRVTEIGVRLYKYFGLRRKTAADDQEEATQDDQDGELPHW